MRPVQLLFDEHVSNHLANAVRRNSPATRLFRVGRPPAPPIGTADPELLAWAEENHCILVSFDRASLPTHFSAHLAAGRHCWGIVIIAHDASFQHSWDDLVTIAAASYAEDWLDRLTYLPL